MKNVYQRTTSLTTRRFVVITILIVTSLYMIGCSGASLIPRDLKDFVSADLKIDRRKVELTQPFRTAITLRVNPMPVNQARQAEHDLIGSCIKYFQRDYISDFINDTLVFIIRLDNDPGINIKWWTVTDDMRMLVKGSMTMDEFAERCRKEEHWSPDL